ncbi:MAG TPA: glycoside hydrolase family 28 protein [Verrucomicrobiae bacterium]|nr:glycoside hydrolase family 28 protein [Verrucomicrobiae bacterium]
MNRVVIKIFSPSKIIARLRGFFLASCQLSLLVCLANFSVEASSQVFDVCAFGAKGDGQTLDTAAIQKALDECGKAGGGVVDFPAGVYLSQPIVLRNKTTMRFETGATLLATTDQSDFMKVPGDWLKAKSSGDFIPFISGKDLTDVTLTGNGKIDGNGVAWWGEAEKARRIKSGYTLPRPNLIVLERCRNLWVENITLQNSPKFHFVPTECEGVVVSNVTILAPEHAANTDAIDPSACKNVLITKCRIDVGDDNVAIKAGHAVRGREFASEDITVTDCVFLHGHGMSIGSETLGGVRNVTVRNCTFENTENGIRIKSQPDRGGLVENINYSDITMKNVDPAITLTCVYSFNSAKDAVQNPANDSNPTTDKNVPVFRNIHIQNLTATCQRAAGVIIGLPQSLIADVVLENVHIDTATTGLMIRNAKGIELKNVQITAKKGSPVIAENAQVEGLEKLSPPE